MDSSGDEVEEVTVTKPAPKKRRPATAAPAVRLKSTAVKKPAGEGKKVTKNENNAKNNNTAGPAEGDKGKRDQQRTEEMEGSDEENNGGGTSEVDMILSKLGSELHNRMKIKRQRLVECFDSVRATPDEILKTLNSQTQDRVRMIEDFKTDSKKVLEDVEKVLTLQRATEDLFSQMIQSTQKQFDQIKEALGTTIKGLNDSVDKLAHETDELEGKHGDEAKRQLQKIQQDLGNLQKKILKEGKQEEADSIKSTLQLV